MGLEIRAITGDERDECLRLWCSVFTGENNEDYFRRYFYGDVEWLPYYTTVAVLDGQIVSAVQIVKRTVACGEYQLTMGGIANVATLPEFRGKGYNKLCLEQAIRVMEADAMDFSLLYTGIPDYYAKFGYTLFPTCAMTGAIRPELAPISTEFQIHPAGERDLPAVRDCYAAYNRQRPFAVQRNEAYWRDWLNIGPGSVPDGLFVVTDSEQHVVGYAKTTPANVWMFSGSEDTEGFVSELAIHPELTDSAQEEAATALLQEIALGYRSVGAERIRLEIAFDRTTQSAIERVLLEPKESRNESGMVRLLHHDTLLRSASMELNTRPRTDRPTEGLVTVETPYGLTRLEARVDFVRVEPTEEAKNVISQADFLAGFGALASHMAPLNGADWQTLFTDARSVPCPVYWNADGF